jgi:hypothetical protein
MTTIGSERYSTGENEMNRFHASWTIAAVAAFGSWAVPANAAPPTVTPSPGYDARLQEQRAARTVYEPAVPVAKPAPRRRVKRAH